MAATYAFAKYLHNDPSLARKWLIVFEQGSYERHKLGAWTNVMFLMMFVEKTTGEKLELHSVGRESIATAVKVYH